MIFKALLIVPIIPNDISKIVFDAKRPTRRKCNVLCLFLISTQIKFQLIEQKLIIFPKLCFKRVLIIHIVTLFSHAELFIHFSLVIIIKTQNKSGLYEIREP